MDYEKKYKEAIEKATALYKAAEPMSGCNVLLETIFPELEESEDEKIRKELIKYFTKGREFLSIIPYNTEEVIAWLEKQGEQKPAEWSEEDGRNLKGIIDEIEANKNNAPDYDLATYDRFLSWLKSLRPQNRWKPSVEQMDALSNALSLAKSCGEESSYDLRTLYEQLKKLKEE